MFNFIATIIYYNFISLAAKVYSVYFMTITKFYSLGSALVYYTPVNGKNTLPLCLVTVFSLFYLSAMREVLESIIILLPFFYTCFCVIFFTILVLVKRIYT